MNGVFQFADLSARMRRRLQGLRARARYRLALPEPAPREVSIAPHFRHPIEASQRSVLTARYRELFPAAVRAELAEARRLAAHCFTLLGHTMNHGERIAWSRDPVSGQDWSSVFSPDIPYRGPERLGDIKLSWELNKHQYFFTLGKAAWLTGDAATAVEIIRQIEQWIEDNPCRRGIHWISALEVGARAISWIMAYPFYADHCDASFQARWATSLAQHMLFVERRLSIGRFANTHLVGEAAALVVGGLFLNYRHSRRWLEKGLTLLEQAMERQVTTDGVHAERSIAYHRFCLDHYYLVSSLLVANGRSLSVEALRGMERMTHFLMDILFPDGSAPAFGDGDDARGFWFRADCPTDYRSLLALGATLFGRGDFKATAGGLTEEVLWLLGIEGITKFQALTTRQPDYRSAAYPEGGYYVMRGGWSASDPMLVFDCGPLGHGPAGHGHADALSFQLYAGGYPFLVDPGTFSYNLDYAWRDAFRSTKAHNTIIVDNLDQSVPGDRMSWKSQARSYLRRWVTTRWFDLVDGEHDGYQRLPDPVTHRRMALFLKPDTWWIWDRLDGNGRHDLEALLHLTPDCSVEPEAGGARIILQSPEGVRLHVWISRSKNGDPIRPPILVGGEEQRAAWFSPKYGVRIPARALRIRRQFVNRTALSTCLSTSSPIVPLVMEENGAFRVEINRGDGIEDAFFYRAHADWSTGYEGIHFDGKILYRRKIAGSHSVIWAGEFRQLSLTGFLQVCSSIPIDSLAFENNRCEIALAADSINELQIKARKGMRFVVNGQPAPIDIMVIHSTAVNS